MGIVRKGSPFDGLTGRVGDLVFRSRGDRTIVSRRPRKRDPKLPRTPKLEKTLTRFQQAVRFASEARHRQSFRSLSRTLRGYSPYHVALQDFLSQPVIESVDATGVGPQGGELVIRVSERIGVRAVRVRMVTPTRSEGPPAVDSSKAPVAPPAEAARPRVLADIFFRPAGGSPRAGQDPPAGTTYATTAPLAAVETRATRHLGVQHKQCKGEAPEERVEIWRVAVPRVGEVEITAFDYAGNRAVMTLTVGPGAERDDDGQ